MEGSGLAQQHKQQTQQPYHSAAWAQHPQQQLTTATTAVPASSHAVQQPQRLVSAVSPVATPVPAVAQQPHHQPA
eukprot:11026208-Ditylum_brightwellii.AAC.1